MSKQKHISQPQRNEIRVPEEPPSLFGRYIEALGHLLHAAALIGRLPFQSASTDVTEQSVKRRIEALITAHVQRRSDLIISTSYPPLVRTVTHRVIQETLSNIYSDLHARSLLPLSRPTNRSIPTNRLPTEPLGIERSSLKDLAVATQETFLVLEYTRIWAGSLNIDICNDANRTINSLNNPSHADGRQRRLVDLIVRQAERYAVFAASHGYMLLSILSHSEAFRYACKNLKDPIWRALGLLIIENATSIEIFAKVRGLDWTTALNRLPPANQVASADIQERFDIAIARPHDWVVPDEGGSLTRPNFEGRDQEDIETSLYQGLLFARARRPAAWPQQRPYPSDPLIRRDSSGNCIECNSPAVCECNPEDCAAITCPVVELRWYGHKGVGVRSLEYIRRGDIVGQYLGDIVPVNLVKADKSFEDGVYSFEFSYTADGAGVAHISSKLRGNWTRYCNHHCESNLDFDQVAIGRRCTVVLRAKRDIEPFQELSVDYGPAYWTEERLCRCGSSVCEYSTPEKIRAKRLRTEKIRTEQRVRKIKSRRKFDDFNDDGSAEENDRKTKLKR